MFLLVKTTGSKLWQMKYRFAGKENIFQLVAPVNFSEVAVAELVLEDEEVQ